VLVSVEIEIVDDPAWACAAMMVGAASGAGHVVLTGGSTPRVAYREFVRVVASVQVDLTATTFWFGDERCVAPDDERSNFGMATAALFGSLAPENQPRVRRMKGELGPAAGADDYAEQLTEFGPEEFDLLLLGIGSDGHTASMFPDQTSLHERSRLVVGVEHAGLEPFVPRITLTLPALARARRVVVLATGASKAGPVAAAFGSEARPDPHVPASMLAGTVKELTVLLDADAAEML
jgi:6-phosphogluconolactonase